MLSQRYPSAVTDIVFNIEQESANLSSEEPDGKYLRLWGPVVSITATRFWVRVLVSVIYSLPTPGTQNLDFSPCVPYHVYNCVSCSFHFIFLLRSQVIEHFIQYSTLNLHNITFTNMPKFAWPLDISMYYSFLTILHAVITSGYWHPSQMFQARLQTRQQSKYHNHADHNYFASGGSFLQ